MGEVIDESHGRIHDIKAYAYKNFSTADDIHISFLAKLYGRDPEEAAIATFHWETRDPLAMPEYNQSISLSGFHGNAPQELMDMLWGLGLRPTEVKIEIGALPATERHLEDMRALVFKKHE